MELQDIITMISNTGVSIAIIAFYMYKDIKFMTTLNKTLQVLVDTVNNLKESIDKRKGE